MSYVDEMKLGFETAYINGNIASNLAYKPQFISNDNKAGRKVLSSIEDELLQCDEFQISVAFITLGGIEPLLQTLQVLNDRKTPGKILTTNYLFFSEPKALEKLRGLGNIEIKMYDAEAADEGFHTKGYIFKKSEVYRIIIGSSNMTRTALTTNREWNTKIVSTEQGEVAQEIIAEFEALWSSSYALSFDEFFENYKEQYEIIKKQREIAKQDEIPSIEKYQLRPNSMQTRFISSLRSIYDSGQEKALLISATGTGKTFASAFAMRELDFKRVLFLVHRERLAKQALESYKKVFAKTVTMGVVGSGYSEYNVDYVFAMVQTLSRDEHLHQYQKDSFDCIIIDEAHHAPAETYGKIMKYFTPKHWLGMTATPDKRDDDIEGRNVYEIFNHQIAYEIRLQQAMEEDLLCPFHYFGISDVSMIDDKQIKAKKMKERDFKLLTGDERVKHIIEKAQYYGYSGNKVKGLIFCSRKDESIELSKKFNLIKNPETGEFFRTIPLDGNTPDAEREKAFERLAMDEEDATEDIKPLDYIFSVEILNEGVDIVEVNQVIMLRPTQSPIVFIQQLGRGLRKAEGKEFVVVLDFIGNYNNNYMIPIALSGDRSYNRDTIRKYVISGNNTIPGASTVHFDEIAKDRIFSSIDRIRGIKTIIKNSYLSLKNRLGRVPYLKDFHENGEIDPLVIVKEYRTYQSFLESVEHELYNGKISADEMITLEYLSKTVLSGARPYELEIIRSLLNADKVSFDEMQAEFKVRYGYEIDLPSFEDALGVLQGKFVSKEEEHERYCHIDILSSDTKGMARRLDAFANNIQHAEFYKQVNDIVEVGLQRYRDKHADSVIQEMPFVLYEKYSRRDVSLLMNCGRDLSSTMYGMKRIGDDVFIFVTYHKALAENQEYLDGRPDYADAFEDNMIFKWDSQMGKGIDSSYVLDVSSAARKHLLVKKSDAETNFYYLGQFDIIEIKAAKKRDNKGKERDIAKFQMKMHHPVREDLLRYLQSNISADGENVG